MLGQLANILSQYELGKMSLLAMHHRRKAAELLHDFTQREVYQHADVLHTTVRVALGP